MEWGRFEKDIVIPEYYPFILRVGLLWMSRFRKSRLNLGMPKTMILKELWERKLGGQFFSFTRTKRMTAFSHVAVVT